MSHTQLIPTVNDLPVEILTKIFSHFSQEELVKCICEVSVLWFQIGVSAPFWKEVLFLDSVHKPVFPHIQSSIKRLTISNEQLYVICNRMKCRGDTMPNLVSLYISTRFIWTESFEQFIMNCDNLEEISYTPDRKDDMVVSLDALSKLSLTKMKIGYYDTDIEVFNECLQALVLSQSRLSTLIISAWHKNNGSSITKIINMQSSLTTIKIYNEFLDGSPFDSSVEPLNLTEVVMNSPSLSDLHVQRITERCRNLTVIDIRNGLHISGETLRYLGQNCPLLEEISLGARFTFEGYGITGINFKYFVEGCPKLTKISFLKCEYFNDADAVALVSNCPSIKLTHFRMCNSLTDKAVYAIAEGCPNLESAGFQENRHITFNCVVKLIQSCRKLKELDVSSCSGITLTSSNDCMNVITNRKPLNPLEQNCTCDKCLHLNDICNNTLTRLKLSRCRNLSVKGVMCLAKLCSCLKILDCQLPTNEKDRKDHVKQLFEANRYLQKLRLSKQNKTHHSINRSDIV